MRSYKNLYPLITSEENLLKAYEKARKGKSRKNYLIEFRHNLTTNLQMLRIELLLHSYKPKPLKSFTIRDPKTRKISKSDFKDRIVHHALINIIEPIFDKTFIHDSFANRKTKGTLAAINRFDKFKRESSKNNSKTCYVLKADIKHYFKEINTFLLIKIIKEKIKDPKTIWLIQQILNNHEGGAKQNRVFLLAT